MPLEPGFRLGPYEIVAPLGAGGMGEVYRAHDPRLKRDVAIKVLPDTVANDPKTLARFEREACAASALNHPNILTVHDFESESGKAYLVTELLEGRSLREMIARGPMPLARVLDIAIQIAKGLAAAHEAGIIHRDLKPGNLFVTRDGIAKILDFGLVRLVHEDGEEVASDIDTMIKTAEGAVLGTLGYMAPEQVGGEKSDARADLFSFGCVLYEMLTGKRAFARDSRVQTLVAILEEEPEDPATLGQPLPQPIAHILRHCLEKDRARRFQSSRDLLFALEEAVSSSDEAASSLPRSPRLARSRWWLMGLAAVVVVATIWILTRTATSEPAVEASVAIDSLAVLPLSNLSGDASQEYFSDGMTEALIAELAKLQALKVISRTSVMRFKGTTSPLPSIARELGVRGIIEGSVLHDGDQVRITVQLIDALEDRHLWAESYTRSARDVLRLQSEVARSIARQVNVAVSDDEERALARATDVNPEAYRKIMEATELVRRGSTQAEEQNRIRRLVDEALELDPGYAPAHAFLAELAIGRAGTGYEAGAIACPDARSHIERALGIDPDLVTARLSDAWLTFACSFNWTEGESLYRSLLVENPGDARIHDQFAVLLSTDGNDEEALEHSRIAFDLDPLSDWVAGHRIHVLTNAQRYSEAVDVATAALRYSSDSVLVQWQLGRTQLTMGDTEAALATFLSRKVSRPEMNPKVGVVYARAGRLAEAREVLDYLLEKRKQHYVSATMIAAIYANIGEPDEAFDWLETAYEEIDFFLPWLATDVDFDRLLDDPRAKALMEKINLTPAG